MRKLPSGCNSSQLCDRAATTSCTKFIQFAMLLSTIPCDVEMLKEIMDVCPQVAHTPHVILPHPHINYGIRNGCMEFVISTAVLTCFSDMNVDNDRTNTLLILQMCDAKCTADQEKHGKPSRKLCGK